MGEPDAVAPDAPGHVKQGDGLERMLLAALVVAMVTVIARAPTAHVPLDQDCAVYTYVAQRWAAGELPYKDVWDHKSPAIYALYRGVLAATSESVPVGAALRAASCVVDILTAIFVLLLARRLFGLGAGFAAGLLVAVGLASPDLQYEALQPERLVAMFLAAGFFAVVVAVDVRCWIAATLAGLMLGAAVAAKPVAAPACVVAWLWAVGCLWRVRDEKRVKRIVIHTIAMVVAAAAPWCVGALYFAAKGAFQEFWSCTFSYNVLYASAHRKGSLAAGLTPMLTKKMNEQGWLWLLAAAGVLVALARPTTRRGGLLAAGWMAAAFLGALLPGQLAYYYYVPTVAALALAGGLALSSAWRGFAAKQARGVIPASILMVVLAAGLVQAVRSQVYSGNSHYKRIQNPEGLNAVVMDVAQYIRDTTESEDRLYVWGSRAQLYVLSDRQAVTPYLYNYSYKLPLGEAYHFQAEKLEAIMAALEEHKPPCIAATETKTLEETGGFTALRKYLDTHYSIEREWEAWDGLEAWEGKPYTVTLFRRRGDAGQ